jgi:4-hydroxybenzoate polyprenyltransferase
VLDTTAPSAPAGLHDAIDVPARDLPCGSPLIELLRLYRVRQWVHILPLPLATFDASVPAATALLAAVRGMANIFAILAFGFLVNAIADRYMDRDARKNPLVVPGRNRYKLSLIALPAVSVALAAFSPWPVQLATVSCLAVGVLYSVGPRLKTIPVVGTLANAAWYVPMLVLGMASPELPAGFGTIAIAFTALLLQNQLIHESGDRVEDEASGIRTTWVAFGPRWSALFAACAGALAIVMTTPALGPFRYAVGTVFIAVFPLLLAWDGLSAERAARLRVVHRWCAVLFGAALYAAWRGWL